MLLFLVHIVFTNRYGTFSPKAIDFLYRVCYNIYITRDADNPKPRRRNYYEVRSKTFRA